MSIREFLARAVPWPTPERPGYVNIHWTNRDAATGAFRGLSGNAYEGHVTASGFVFGMARNDVDLYVCMSLQGESDGNKLTKSGKQRRVARRSWHQSLWLRSWWVDVDVKPGFFATTADAMEAFKAWCIKVGMPVPTFIVMTGSGGFHAHWVVDEPVSRETWLETAYALQQALKAEKFPCDYGVVVNPACILRIPGTKNHKLTPPGDVVLHDARPYTYPVSFIQQVLAPYRMPFSIPMSTGATGATLSFKPNPKLANLPLGPRLDAGVEGWTPTVEDVAVVCPFMAVTLMDAGKGHGEPLWFEALKVVAFCRDPIKRAHDVSRGHDDYDPDETDKKFMGVAAHHGNGRVGWPQCRTIDSAGAIECKRCPHLVANRSPLNYAEPVTPARPSVQAPAAPVPQMLTALIGSPVTAAPQPIMGVQNFGYGDLPFDHRYTIDGFVEAEVDITDKQGNVSKTWEQVFPYPVYSIKAHSKSLEGLGSHGMSFQVLADSHHLLDVVVKATDVMDQKAFNAAVSIQSGVSSKRHPQLRAMLVSFREQMRLRKRSTVPSEAFGWSTLEGQSEPSGFCYGGLRYSAAGVAPYTPVEPEIAKKYVPCGSLVVWKKAAALIVDQQRPDLICAIAAAFGGPLLHWTGLSGIVLSLWSSASGIGKTHAMRVGQATWGNPKTGMGSLNDTSNYVNGMVSQLRHLPFFYDELRQEADTKKLVDLIFAMGQGKSKGRMSASAEIKDVFGFSTMLTVASNNSLMDYINDHVKTTSAGINRIFELEIASVPNAPGRIDSTIAQQINGDLEHNYGHAGAVYAQYLGANIPKVRAAVAAMASALNSMLGADHDERFWVITVAVLLLGAKYANHLGLTQIDEGRLATYLLARFHENRAYRKGAPVDMNQQSNALRYLQDYINARRDSTLSTDVVWVGATKPTPGYKAIQTDANNDLTGKKIYIRHAVNTGLLRVSVADFGAWLKKERSIQQRNVIIDALKNTAGGKAIKTSLGVNTRYVTAREDALEFDLTTLPDLLS